MIAAIYDNRFNVAKKCMRNRERTKLKSAQNEVSPCGNIQCRYIGHWKEAILRGDKCFRRKEGVEANLGDCAGGLILCPW